MGYLQIEDSSIGDRAHSHRKQGSQHLQDLPSGKIGKHTRLRDKRVVIALLHHSAVLEHNYSIGIYDGT
jgi:hypothetical protein